MAETGESSDGVEQTPILAEDDMAKTKLIVGLVLVALVLIVVLQNTQPTETRILFVTLTMPRAALLAMTLLVGVGAGMLLALGLSVKKVK